MVVMMIGVTEVMSSIVVKTCKHTTKERCNTIVVNMTTHILSILTTPVVAKPCTA